MTRVNTVEPVHLTDQHLIAEHREYGIALYSFLNSLNSKYGIVPSKISKEYTLNKGHVYFFYDKMGYLQRRHQLLKAEAKRRGFKLELNPDWTQVPPLYLNDWTPTAKDHSVNIERLIIRINEKPLWYRYMGSTINTNFCDVYTKYTELLE
jgi:deoxyribonuclease (pyrimidine dimer)